MDIFFPFGYPWPTTFYLTLYVLTLLLHVVPMNYVLAGSTYWAATAFFAKMTLSRCPTSASPRRASVRVRP